MPPWGGMLTACQRIRAGTRQAVRLAAGPARAEGLWGRAPTANAFPSLAHPRIRGRLHPGCLPERPGEGGDPRRARAVETAGTEEEFPHGYRRAHLVGCPPSSIQER